MDDIYFTTHGGLTLERIHYEGEKREGQIFKNVDGKWGWYPCPTAEDIYFWDYLDWDSCTLEQAEEFMTKEMENNSR